MGVRSATGLPILRAIVADERDPGRLSMLKNNYVRASRQKIAQSLIDQSLQGTCGELLFVLEHSLELYDTILLE